MLLILGEVVGVGGFRPGHAREFLALPAQNLTEPVVEMNPSLVRRRDGHADEAELEVGAKLLLPPTQFLLRRFTLGDVFGDSQQVLRPALLVVDGDLPGVDEAATAMPRVEGLSRDVHQFAVGQCPPVILDEPRGHFRREEVVVVFAHHFGVAVARESLARLVPQHKPQIAGLLDEHGDGQVLDDGGEKGLGALKLFFAAFAFGDVHGHAQKMRDLALFASQRPLDRLEPPCFTPVIREPFLRGDLFPARLPDLLVVLFDLRNHVGIREHLLA